MNVGVPKETKSAEKRVAATPSFVKALVDRGHHVFVESGAGVGAGMEDETYAGAGASLLESAPDVWAEADLILKVKEPIAPEFDYMKPGQILFTYLHLAADLTLTQRLLDRKVVGIAYETVQLADGSLPLLAPMSEVAGALSVQAGAQCLEATNGGRGVLLSGVPGVRSAKVTVLGGGTAGLAAALVAAGMGARVCIFEVNHRRLTYIRDVASGRVEALYSNQSDMEQECAESDLVVGSVLIPGARAPKLVSRDLLRRMAAGSAFVDISVDQGGCAETTRPTTHLSPTYMEEGVVHYCVANMPGAVPRTSTMALTNATSRYALALADSGWRKALAEDRALEKGLNVCEGTLTCAPVAEAFGLPFVVPASVLETIHH